MFYVKQLLEMKEKQHQFFCFKSICSKLCADDPILNKEVSCFNLERSPLLSLPDNDIIDEDLNDTLLQINMSVPPENPESCQCVLVAFTCLHVYTFISS